MLSKRARSAPFAIVGVCFVATATSSCSEDEVKYQPKPAVTGAKANLPPVPNVPQKPIKAGDAYTVWGASYTLRSRVHRKEVAGQKLSITGYITKTNLPEAPECAVHKTGVADPEDCKPPIPTFWIGDTKDAPPAETMQVMGWASNFAQIFDAIKEYDTGKEDAEYNDQMWGVKLPNPLPAPGAKVTVSGPYSTTFTLASSGAEADPIMGILTFQGMTYLEEAPELSTLPGVKRKPKK